MVPTESVCISIAIKKGNKLEYYLKLRLNLLECTQDHLAGDLGLLILKEM